MSLKSPLSFQLASLTPEPKSSVDLSTQIRLKTSLMWHSLCYLHVTIWCHASHVTSLIWYVVVVSTPFASLVVSTSFVTPWTVARQTLLPMGFPRQEYRSELPFPSPGDLSDLWIEHASPTLQVDSLPTEPPGKLLPYFYLCPYLCFEMSVFLTRLSALHK